MSALSLAEIRRSMRRSLVGVAVMCAVLLAADRVSGQGSTPANTEVPAAAVSSFVSGLVRMKEANVDAQVLRTYVQSASTPYRLSTDEIIYLHQHGVDSDLISAAIRRGNELRQQAFTPAQTANAETPIPPAPQTVAPPIVQTAPSPVVVTAGPVAPVYPIYVEAYPEYLYPRYRYWPIYYRPSYWWPVSSVYWSGHARGYARGHDWIRPGVVNHINARPSAGGFGGPGRPGGGGHGGRRH